MLEWRRLVSADDALLPAPVRYELLSGTRDDRAFEEVLLRLRPMASAPVETGDVEEAARCRNACADRGIAASPIDMFLCAMALRRGCALFTTDGDFERYARVLPIRLHSPR